MNDPFGAPILLTQYDGEDIEQLRARWRVPAIRAYGEATSTMDLAHVAAADGAPSGTVVVADVQTAGRGRSGRRWISDAGAGVWATIIERPRDVDALAVLSLRVGLALAAELQAVVEPRIALKWPNDLLVTGRKLAGVLVEARWRDGAPEWVAVGVGVNRTSPIALPESIGIGPTVARHAILAAVVRAVRDAGTRPGGLSAPELAAFAERDAVYGREVLRPVAGHAAGITARGELLVRTADGTSRAVPTATIEYAGTPA